MKLHPIAIKMILPTFILGAFALSQLPESALATEQAVEDEPPITLEELEQLQPFPEGYGEMPHEARLDWLNTQLDKTNSAAEDYNFAREIAFQHFANYENSEARTACQHNPPLAFDFRYRHLCIMASDISYDDMLNRYIELYKDVSSVDDKAMLAQILTSMGWYQSANGDIDLAFKSYEEALSLGEYLNLFALTDLMANTASLYIMHGDKEHIDKGIDLHKETITKLVRQKEEEPEIATYLEDSITSSQFNIGTAYALHLHDYKSALHWFKLVIFKEISKPDLKLSALVFGALSAAKLGHDGEAEQLLALSYNEPEVRSSEHSYLNCYRELAEYELQKDVDLRPCLPLHRNVPLEVTTDVYQRISELEDNSLANEGRRYFYELYTKTLEKQLKQSSSSAASTAELYRQQQESRLINELLEKEIALKTAEQARRDDQIRLAIAVLLILLLLIGIILIRLNQKRRMAEQYERLSVLDVLTGLKNRRFLEQNIDRELNFIRRSQAQAEPSSIGIYLLDIDYFKSINDTYGHASGDAALIEFARRINDTIRDSDLFVRWGGEEFLLVARLEQGESLKVLATRLMKEIKSAPYKLGQNTLVDLTCTIGAVVYPCTEGNAKDISWNKLVKLADMALYYGKEKQRDCWVCIDRIIAPASWDDFLRQDIEESLQKDQIKISTSITKTD